MRALVLMVSGLAALMVAAAEEARPVRGVGDGIHLLPGGAYTDRGPDGNTVIIDAPQGLIVVDTGRHAWHSDAILGFAAAAKRPIVAIVNTHWHLDHSSGNGRLKRVHAGAQVYTTNAVDRALAPGGFLVRDLEMVKGLLGKPEFSVTRQDDFRRFIATMAERDVLRPDVVLTKSGPMTLAGKTLDVRVTDKAVTDADVWLYDANSGVAIIGDLVTVPVPFFETACPRKWGSALDEVWRTPFKLAIPGHGEPMSREQFNVYRTAFHAFVDCAVSDKAVQQCGKVWSSGVASLTAGNASAQQEAQSGAEYYTELLREGGGKSRDCLAE